MANRQTALLMLFALIFQSANGNWWYLGLETSDLNNKLTSSEFSTLLIKNDQVDDEYDETKANLAKANNLYELNRQKSETFDRISGLRKYCRNINVLTSPVQRKLCQRNVKIVEIVARAAKLAIDECQHQFKYKRWNCSIFNDTNVFGKLMQTRSREISFIYAINSAAAMYETTKACSKGELKKCSCTPNKNQDESMENQNSNQFKWNGCSDNVFFGHKLSKNFVDSKEYYDSLTNPIRLASSRRENIYLNKEYKLMNLHNNEVGRRAILKNMKTICKCHGVSGSCSVKVCWKVMPEFRVIGDELFRKYNQAMQLKDTTIKNRVKKLKIIVSRRSTGSNNQQVAYRDDLIFIDKSPNFCRRNPDLDTPGTSGRMCSLETQASRKKMYNGNFTYNSIEDEATPIERCDYLCCGRGYYSKVVETEYDCDCQFQWCCSVKCKKCKKKVVQYFCN